MHIKSILTLAKAVASATILILVGEGHAESDGNAREVRDGMTASSDLAADARRLLRSGFYSREEIVRTITEELYEPGEVDHASACGIVDEELAKLRVEQDAWPKETDCDRLDQAFNDLKEARLIALQNAGLTQSDGYEDFREALDRSPSKDSIIGYCFYHSQDVDTALDGDGLYLAFGPANPKLEESEGARIGRIVAEVLMSRGFKVNWDGKFNSRILIENFDWRRRLRPGR